MRISDWSSDVCSSDLPDMKFLRLLPLALITALSACHHQADTAEAATPLRAVRAVVVATGPAEAPIVATGLLATRAEVQLGFKTGGVVRRIAVRGGDAVHAGEDRKSTRLNSSH